MSERCPYCHNVFTNVIIHIKKQRSCYNSHQKHAKPFVPMVVDASADEGFDLMLDDDEQFHVPVMPQAATGPHVSSHTTSTNPVASQVAGRPQVAPNKTSTFTCNESGEYPSFPSRQLA